jgi:type IV pilus assembly protein PilA
MLYMLMNPSCLLWGPLTVGMLLIGPILPSATAAPVKPIPSHQLQAHQTEGQQFLDSINRAQFAYVTEKQQFTTQLPALGLGQRLNTPYYNYRLVQRPASYLVQHFATAQTVGLRSYTSGVFWANIGGSLAPLQPPPSSPQIVVCESLKPTQNMPGALIRQGQAVVCPAGYRSVQI